MQGSLNDFGIPREDSRTMQILMDAFRFQKMDTSTVIWHGSSDPQKVLQLHHREHPDWLHHYLEWQLLGIRLQGATEGSAYGPVHHWGQASCHPGPLYQAVSEEGFKNVFIND